MRAEDRKPAKRVFPLLQNLDLDSVTFSQLQSVGNPISIEDMNEQEMTDLIIVNLARLCVSGEWTGLLEAGGGAYSQTPVLTDATYDTYDISTAAPWGSVSKVDTGTMSNEPAFYPFIAPKTGTINAISIYVAAAATSTCLFSAALYNVDSDTGAPSTKIASIDIDLESTGEIRQTSFTGSMDTTRNQLYYMGWCRSANVGATVRAADQRYTPGPGPTDDTGDIKSHLELQSSNNTLPSTVDETDLQSTNTKTPVMLLEW